MLIFESFIFRQLVIHTTVTLTIFNDLLTQKKHFIEKQKFLMTMTLKYTL